MLMLGWPGGAPGLSLPRRASYWAAWSRAPTWRRPTQPEHSARTTVCASAEDHDRSTGEVTAGQPAGTAGSHLPHHGSTTAAEMLHELENSMSEGRDDEQLALAAVMHASERRYDPGFAGSTTELDALVAVLERLLRRNLVAFTPDQLGAVTRSYVLMGGASPGLLAALQDAATEWAGEDYSLQPLAELTWSLAWIKKPPGPSFARHLQAVVEEQRRDWRAWFGTARAGRLLMLLWGLARLRCQPCEPFLEAACRRLAALPLDGVPSKSLVTLLWALARLEAFDPYSAKAVEAISLKLCTRMEQQLSDEPQARQRPQGSVLASVSTGSVVWEEEGAAQQPRREEQQQRRRQQQQQQQQQSGAAGVNSGPMSAGGRTESTEGEVEGDLAQGSSMSDDLGGQGLGGASEGSYEARSEVPAVAGWEAQAFEDWGDRWAGWRVAGSVGRGRPPESRWGGGGETSRGDLDLSLNLLGVLVWAWGRLRYRNGAGLRTATLLLYGGVRDLTPADISRVLWGMARLEYSQSQLLGALCTHLMQPGVLASFSIPQLATTVYSFAAMDYFPGEPLLDLIADCCLAVRESFDPHNLCHVLWGLARLGYLDEPFYQEFVPVVLGDIDSYGPAELADLSRVYAKFGLAPEGLFEAIAQQTVATMQTADLEDLLRILTAFHQMGLQPDSLLEAVEAWANRRLRQLPPQALTLALGTFARLGGPRSPSLLAVAEECVTSQLDRFEPAQLALLAWSFAKLGYYAREVLDHVVVSLVEHTPKFGDKAISNVLWAVATLRHPLPQIAGRKPLDRIAQNIRGRLKAFGAQSLSNIAWAYATLGRTPSREFLQDLGDAAKGQLRAFESQGMALLVWALATFNYRHEALLRSIDEYCSSMGGRMEGWEAQHLSNLLWGMAKVGYRPGPGFWKPAAREATHLAADMAPQEVFNVAWAYASMRLHPRRLLDALAAEAARRPSTFTSQELSGLLWAMARLGHNKGPGVAALLQASGRELERRGPEFEDRHVAITAWAWGELGHEPTPRALAAVMREAEARTRGLGAQALCTLAKGLAALRAIPSPKLAAALAARSIRLADRLQPFECAELLEAWLALGLHEEAAQLLRFLDATPVGSRPRNSGASLANGEDSGGSGSAGGSSTTSAAAGGGSDGGKGGAAPSYRQSGVAETEASANSSGARGPPLRISTRLSLLEVAVANGKLPALVRILAAMAQLGHYPEPAFAQICERLAVVPPSYKFSQKDLEQLGLALEAADPAHRARIQLHGTILGKVSAAAGTAPGPEVSGGPAPAPAGELENGTEGGAGRVGQAAPAPARRARQGHGGSGRPADDCDEGLTPDAQRHWHSWFPPDELDAI